MKKQIKALIQAYWERAVSQKAHGSNWEFLKYELGKFLRTFGSSIAKHNRLIED